MRVNIKERLLAGGTGLHTSIRSTNPELFKPMVAEHTRVSVKEKIAEKKAEITKKQTKEISKDQVR